ncbi:callose synthase 9-like protein [Trifolium pratense]|uniref:Callose synthase 9-like protein n=1 Tax=Trifolium pratense TaxID=57577 RepID=A0A2K3NDS3_TRIPR|nr:callose synthase 9-like protein [Trifolium pratense]
MKFLVADEEDFHKPSGSEALEKVFLKSLENYINWSNYLCIQPVWSSFEAVNEGKKLLYVSLYLLIWGEASNVRFLPECLCYIFHQMAREMDEVLRQQIAQTANSCTSEDGVSFLDHVILPLYDVISACSNVKRVNKFCTSAVDDTHNFMLWMDMHKII